MLREHALYKKEKLIDLTLNHIISCKAILSFFKSYKLYSHVKLLRKNISYLEREGGKLKKAVNLPKFCSYLANFGTLLEF